MSDEQLRHLGLTYGDTVAVRLQAHTIQSTAATSSSGSSSRCSELLKRLHDRLEAVDDETKMLENKLAKKENRRLELGWLNYEVGEKRYKQVRRKGAERDIWWCQLILPWQQCKLQL